jgi:isopenicillin N synthase-like dioxygenase
MEKERNLPIPIIDIGGLIGGASDLRAIAEAIASACRQWGFFYIINHGVSEKLQADLEQQSREFFSQDLQTKLEIDMARGGRAWRGYFPVGRELTSGIPDRKEGIYFGTELDAEHPLVQSGTPLHGANLFPAFPSEFKQTVLDYMAAMTALGHRLMEGIALSLGLEKLYFAEHYTADPLTLFRIFNYPASPPRQKQENWGVGEHTDYGLLTILRQDDSGGLQIKVKSSWIDAPPLANSFICNIGDMLDRLTGGYYLSTLHRVRNIAVKDRLSFAFFFDPNFTAEIQPLPLSTELRDNKQERWDKASVHEFHGTYGDYLLSKVAKVFPELRREVI